MGQRLGQHFLYDEDILDSIIESAQLGPDSNVLEVGPGKGDLTRKLLSSSKAVTAVEFDPELAADLKKSPEFEKLSVFREDIMDFDLNLLDSSYSVVANIPYYLTSALVKKLLEAKNKPQRAVLLIQKEVAQRLAAKPGKMSVLAVSAQYYANVSLGVEVPAEKFDPPPKVDSQVVIIEVLDQPIFKSDTKKFFRLVKAGFGEKRKKLYNSLAGGLGQSTDSVKDLLQVAGVSVDVRAQELSMDEWGRLYESAISEGVI